MRALERPGSGPESIGRASGNLRRVAGEHAELARTSYALVASSSLFERASPRQLQLLALSPRTGRTHQLRVHAAAHGLPLLGDRAYGGASRLTAETGSVRSLDRIALHAAWVELPARRTAPHSRPRFRAELLDIWGDFAGDEADFAQSRSQASLAD